MWFEKYNPLQVNKAITIESKCWLAFWASYWCWYKSQDLNFKENCESQITEIQEMLSLVDKTIEEYLDKEISGQTAEMEAHLKIIISFLDAVHKNWRPLTINNIKAYYEGETTRINEVIDEHNWGLINRYILNDKSIKDGDDPEIVMLKSLIRIHQIFEYVRPVSSFYRASEN
ncbi:hypothetical protein N8303_02250 [Gammaproteobacteria bacterium]|nr:hypothetical protein [Gammaproteobacteria bacterium]